MALRDLSLPGSATGPLPSPESGLDIVVRQPKIRQWQVPALLVEPGDAMAALSVVREITALPAAAYEPDDAPDVSPGDSVFPDVSPGDSAAASLTGSLGGSPVPGASLR